MAVEVDVVVVGEHVGRDAASRHVCRRGYDWGGVVVVVGGVVGVVALVVAWEVG